MIPALLVWLRVIRDADTDERLSPAAATQQVYSPDEVFPYSSTS